jgi:hypothetical protein
MAFWTVQGEAGKALDATARDLDVIGATGSNMAFPILGIDMFSYSVLLQALTIGAELIPENGQTFTLFRDGTRFFHGHVRRKQAGYRVNVSVLGPMWWLERLQLTTLQTDSVANSAERVTFVFADGQSLTTSVNALLTRAIALGAPIAIGTLAATFNCPRITLNQSTIGAALAELIRLTPDVSGWWDYSVNPPAFNTARRSSMTTRTLAAEDLVEDEWEIEPVSELQAEFVRIPYVGRGTDGQRIFLEQLSGDAGTAQSGSTSTTIKLRAAASFSDDAYNNLTVEIISGTGAGQSKTITDYVGSTKVATVNSAWTTTPNNTSVYKVGTGLPSGAGKTQMLVVSGEELDTFLPNEIFDSVQVKTTPRSTSLPAATALIDYVRANDAFLSSHAAQYGALGAPNNSITYYTGFSSDPTYNVETYPGITFTDPATGANITSGAADQLVVVGDLPDWFKDLYPVTKANLALTWTMAIINSSGTTPTTPWFQAALPKSISSVGGVGGWVNTSATDHIHWVAIPVTLPVSLIGDPFSTLTTVYRPADYGFIAPPAGFAAGMQESQGWLPYTGILAIDEEEVGGTRYRGCKINVTGALPEYATMGALVESEVLDLDSGRTTIRLGAPARLDYRSFVDRTRRTASDNIVYV